MNTLSIARTVLAHSKLCVPEMLFGPSNKPARIAIIESITGEKPKSSECGINRMMDLLLVAFPVHKYSCIADRWNQLRQIIINTSNTSQP